MSVTVLAPGLLTTVQDSGRHGHAAIGVGTAGAMDEVALRLANILVGNNEGAAALEITLRGPRLLFDMDSIVAITGAPIDAHTNDSALPMWRPLPIRHGTIVSLGHARTGARTYLAVAGGVQTHAQLGSRSTDINAGIGGAIVAQDVLSIADTELPGFGAVKWSLDPAPWFDDPAQPIRAVAGAHWSQLDSASQRMFLDADFRISNDSNRVGYRLEGAKLATRESLELVSAGALPGTVQLPPGGAPIVLMAEAPTTGGYPRIAHVAAVDLPRLAQRRPGDHVHFTQVSLAQAQTLYLERERALANIARTIAERRRA
jgi:antagonist of KipI